MRSFKIGHAVIIEWYDGKGDYVNRARIVVYVLGPNCLVEGKK